MQYPIKALIGLGNPGTRYYTTRHNIGFRILDTLAEQYGGRWQSRDSMDVARITIDDHPLILIKPTTFMNNSGKVMPWLTAQGIQPEEIIVVHDELDFPFGKVAFKEGGSARGHNGVKSIIAAGGEKTIRLRFGIDRPADRDQVPDYVLATFKEDSAQIEQAIDHAVKQLTQYVQTRPSQMK